MNVCTTYPCRRTSAGCSLCDPQPWQLPQTLPMPPLINTQPMGCICPPTSEKTCENPMCPRKGIRITAGSMGTPPVSSNK